MDINEENDANKISFQGIQNLRKNKNNFVQNDKIFEQNVNNISNLNTADASKTKNLDYKKELNQLPSFNNISKKKKDIFYFRKIRRFIILKLGRTRRRRKKRIRLNQSKNRNCNAFPKILNSCGEKMDYYIKLNFKGLEDLGYPTVINGDKFSDIISKTVYKMYCDTVPKRFKKDKKIKEKDDKKRKQLKREEYSKIVRNKTILDNFIDKSNKKKDLIFNELVCKDFLIPYLNNENNIVLNNKKYGKVNIKLTGFETYDDCFNYEYTKEQKESFKRALLDKIQKAEQKTNNGSNLETNYP